MAHAYQSITTEGAAGRLSSGPGVSAGLLVQVQSTRLYPPAVVRLAKTATGVYLRQAIPETASVHDPPADIFS